MKARFLPLLAASLGMTVFTGMAFVNNVVAILRWWGMFFECGGDTSTLSAKAPGCFAWLDWSAVDYSAVTTLIPFIGFVCLSVAAARMVRGELVKGEDFPFFRGSDQFMIALGLLGTLWGIIVIGYFQLDTVKMADLMQCLHTALFSTLMAVVWVFVVDRPFLRPIFLGMLRRSGQLEGEEGDLAGAVERLVNRLDDASAAFDRRQREYEAAFDKRQREYTEFFTRRIAELEKRSEASEAKLKAVAEALHS